MSHNHVVHFNNEKLEFDFVNIHLSLQLSEEIILHNKVDQVGFELNTDFDSTAQIDRSLDAFNQLFFINVKLTFSDLSEIRNLKELGYFTQYDKWNYSAFTQNAIPFSESIVDTSFQIMTDPRNEVLKNDFMLYMLETFLGSAKLGFLIKKKTNMINDVISLDDALNTQILNILSPLTTDGVLFEQEYAIESSGNYYPLENLDGTKISKHNPFRILSSSILNENIIDSSDHVFRKEHFKEYLNPIM